MFICLFWDGLVGLFVVEQEIGVKNAARQYVQIAISAWPAHCFMITFRDIVRVLGRTVALALEDGLEIFVSSFGSMVLTFLFGYVGTCLSVVLASIFRFWSLFLHMLSQCINLKKSLAAKIHYSL